MDEREQHGSASTEPPGPHPWTLCIDVGATAIKASLLDAKGQFVQREPLRVPTPRPALPDVMLATLEGIAQREDRSERISIGFPGVIVDGVARSAPNLDGDWTAVPLVVSLAERLRAAGRSVPVRAVNDADLAGIGAAEGSGVEMLITLGTGMGSAVLNDGVLVPNLELGHHPFREGKSYEQLVGDAALKEVGETAWRQRVMAVIAQLRPIWNFRRLYVGGGNARLLQPAAMPPDVQRVDNSIALLGGVRLWRV